MVFTFYIFNFVNVFLKDIFKSITTVFLGKCKEENLIPKNIINHTKLKIAFNSYNILKEYEKDLMLFRIKILEREIVDINCEIQENIRHIKNVEHNLQNSTICELKVMKNT